MSGRPTDGYAALPLLLLLRLKRAMIEPLRGTLPPDCFQRHAAGADCE